MSSVTDSSVTQVLCSLAKVLWLSEDAFMQAAAVSLDTAAIAVRAMAGSPRFQHSLL